MMAFTSLDPIPARSSTTSAKRIEDVESLSILPIISSQIEIYAIQITMECNSTIPNIARHQTTHAIQMIVESTSTMPDIMKYQAIRAI